MKTIFTILLLISCFIAGIFVERQSSISRFHKVANQMDWGDMDYDVSWYIATGCTYEKY